MVLRHTDQPGASLFPVGIVPLPRQFDPRVKNQAARNGANTFYVIYVLKLIFRHRYDCKSYIGKVKLFIRALERCIEIAVGAYQRDEARHPKGHDYNQRNCLAERSAQITNDLTKQDGIQKASPGQLGNIGRTGIGLNPIDRAVVQISYPVGHGSDGGIVGYQYDGRALAAVQLLYNA